MATTIDSVLEELSGIARRMHADVEEFRAVRRRIEAQFPAPKIVSQPVPIRVVCAWCKKVLPTTTDPNAKLVSHGVCPECKEKVQNEGRAQ